LENSEEALFTLASAQCVIDREQVRSRLLELLEEFQSIFHHWSYPEYGTPREGRVLAVEPTFKGLWQCIENFPVTTAVSKA
jgi:hypothetical protein